MLRRKGLFFLCQGLQSSQSLTSSSGDSIGCTVILGSSSFAFIRPSLCLCPASSSPASSGGAKSSSGTSCPGQSLLLAGLRAGGRPGTRSPRRPGRMHPFGIDRSRRRGEQTNREIEQSKIETSKTRNMENRNIEHRKIQKMNIGKSKF